MEFKDIRDDFTSDVYNTLDFLPTNNEANMIIDSFDRVVDDVIVIPKGATNGDMIKALFPTVYSEECDYDIFTTLDGDTRFTYDWWDTPYKRGNAND